jgi:cold shock CspA family protein
MHLQAEHDAGEKRGTVAVAVSESGFGFIEPDHLGGQLPMRAESVEAGRELRVGETVAYGVVTGALGLEAVRVRPVAVAREVAA